MAKKKSETSAEKKKADETKNSGRQSLHNLHDESNAHLRAVEFYKLELKYLQKRLADIVKGNTNAEILSQAEQFQNQFIITKENLDEMNKTLKAQIKVVEKQIKAKPTHLEEKTLPSTGKFNQSIHNSEKDFAAMKLRFNKFLAKYL